MWGERRVKFDRRVAGQSPSVTLRFLHGWGTMMNRRLGWMRRCWEICLPCFKGWCCVKVVEHTVLFSCRKWNPYRLHDCNYTALSHAKIKCPWNDFCIKWNGKTKQKQKDISLLHKAWAAQIMFCVMALVPTSGSSQTAQKRYKRTEFITGCRVSRRGALCLQSTTASRFKSCKERKRQHLQR